MEKLNEPFVFSAQQSPDSSMNLESGEGLGTGLHMDTDKGLDAVGNAKRARAEHDVLGRSDVGPNYMRNNDSGSFKSKLLNMSSPNSWSGFDIDTVGGGDVGGADLNFSNARGGLVLLPATKEVSCLASRWRRAPSPIGGELILTSKQAEPSPATSLEEA
ncbi:hypothetical protein Q3G72_027142 [Acer saccharum]|nr:hypothetical protein Q3G72_027142 [Acer saccharum]